MSKNKDIAAEAEETQKTNAETAGNTAANAAGEASNAAGEAANTAEDAAAADKAAETAEQTAEDKLAKAEEDLAAMKDKYLRQVAEFDNYRKRTMREKAELILNGGEKVLAALLPVLDDLERAADNMEKSDDVQTLKEGVALILDKLGKTLAAQGLKKMDTDGKEFDTDFHEAIALVPAADEAQKNHVIDCVQAGYTLNEKVLRHAKVVVGQ